MRDSAQNSIYRKQRLSVDISHTYIQICSTRMQLRTVPYDIQQDKTQPLMKIARNRRNRIAAGMKQVSQHMVE